MQTHVGRAAEARERALLKLQRLVVETEAAKDPEAAAYVAQAMLLLQRERRR
jgi:hypothetical protein